jgi:phosphohistidine phosphatase
MHLLIIRHAVAEDREAFAASGQDDSLRPLTKDGRKKMRVVAAGLADVAPRVDVLATSPFVRAVETADIVAAAFHRPSTHSVDALTPERSATDFVDWMHRVDGADVVAAVGHEPHLGRLVSWLVSARKQPFMELKKGGACLLDLGASPAPGMARLLWALTPKQLRRLAPSH